MRASTSLAEQPVASTSQGELREGAIVNYIRNGKSGLALITARDGKRNWLATDLRCAASMPTAATLKCILATAAVAVRSNVCWCDKRYVGMLTAPL